MELKYQKNKLNCVRFVEKQFKLVLSTKDIDRK